MWQPFRQALRELGYVEGQNIAYEYRYGEGAPDRLSTVAAELVRRPVDLIATYGTQATRAVRPGGGGGGGGITSQPVLGGLHHHAQRWNAAPSQELSSSAAITEPARCR